MGCNTAFSCQGDREEPASIGFVGWSSLQTALSFLADTAVEIGERELFLRMAQCSIDPLSGAKVAGKVWTIEAWPDLWWRARRPRPARWATDQYLFCVLFFPTEDLDPITKIVRQFRERLTCGYEPYETRAFSV